MIGLALVTLVATLASGITQTFRGAVNDLFTGDYAVTAQNNFSPIPIAAAEAVATAPACGRRQRSQRRRAGVGKPFFATAVDPGTKDVIALNWKRSQDVLGSLGEDGAFVDDGYADDHDLASDRRSRSPSSAATRVRSWSRASSTRRAEALRRADHRLGGRLGRGEHRTEERLLVRADHRRRDRREPGGARPTLASFPNAKAQTREAFIDNQISGLASVLNILYVLLALWCS